MRERIDYSVIPGPRDAGFSFVCAYGLSGLDEIANGHMLNGQTAHLERVMHAINGAHNLLEQRSVPELYVPFVSVLLHTVFGSAINHATTPRDYEAALMGASAFSDDMKWALVTDPNTIRMDMNRLDHLCRGISTLSTKLLDYNPVKYRVDGLLALGGQS